MKMVKCVRDKSGIFKVGKTYETYMCGRNHCIMTKEYIPNRTKYLELHNELWDFIAVDNCVENVKR